MNAPPGLPGPAGDRGDAGMTGEFGKQGDRGDPGPQGEDGLPVRLSLICLFLSFSYLLGPHFVSSFCKGSLGLNGVPGPKGQKGEESVAREKGDLSSLLLFPVSVLKKVSKDYSLCLYMCATAGYQGDSGDPGLNGEPGEAGAPGRTGLPGFPGSRGFPVSAPAVSTTGHV